MLAARFFRARSPIVSPGRARKGQLNRAPAFFVWPRGDGSHSIGAGTQVDADETVSGNPVLVINARRADARLRDAFPVDLKGYCPGLRHARFHRERRSDNHLVGDGR